MTIERQDVVDIGVERLTHDLQEKENVVKLLTLFLTEVQAIEDMLISLLDIKSITDSYGFSLDLIGKIVGVTRGTLDDEDYRSAIRLQISINTSNGTMDEIIRTVKSYTASTNTFAVDSSVAFTTLYCNGQTNISKNLWGLVDSIKPVGTKWLIHSDFYDNAFRLAYEQSVRESESFQTTVDGVVYENFQTTSDGVNYEDFLTDNESIEYSGTSLVEGRNSFYYEVLEDAGTIPPVEDFHQTLPFCWEINSSSSTITEEDDFYILLELWTNYEEFYANYLLPEDLTSPNNY